MKVSIVPIITLFLILYPKANIKNNYIKYLTDRKIKYWENPQKITFNIALKSDKTWCPYEDYYNNKRRIPLSYCNDVILRPFIDFEWGLSKDTISGIFDPAKMIIFILNNDSMVLKSTDTDSCLYFIKSKDQITKIN